MRSIAVDKSVNAVGRYGEFKNDGYEYVYLALKQKLEHGFKYETE